MLKYLLLAFIGLLVGLYFTERHEILEELLPPIVAKNLDLKNPYFSKTSGFQKKDFQSVDVSSVEDFWNSKPCNSGWEFDQVEKNSHEYFELVEKKKYTVEPHIPGWADFASWKGKSVLEVGGGLCTTAVSFAKAGAKVTVVDLSSESLKLCKLRFKIYNLTAEFYHGNSEKLSSFVPVKQYDLVWSFGVIHHTPYPERVLAEMQKYMGPETVLKVMVYSKVSYKLFWVFKETGQWDFEHMDEIVAHYSEAKEGSPVTYTYTNQGGYRLMKDFEVTAMRKDHIFAFDIPSYRRGELKRDKLFAGISDERFRELESELGWHLLIDARLKR